MIFILDFHTYRIYDKSVIYEWDEAKRVANQIKHGLDLTDADLVLENPYVFVVDSPRKASAASRRLLMCSRF